MNLATAKAVQADLMDLGLVAQPIPTDNPPTDWKVETYDSLGAGLDYTHLQTVSTAHSLADPNITSAVFY